MNRGSPPCSRTYCDSTGRFNEAPIHESGKWLPSSSGGPNRSGFNEAPIHESGKFAATSMGRAGTDALQ